MIQSVLFMVPLLSFSNSHCGSDNTTQRGDFLLVAACVFVNCAAQHGVKLNQCGSKPNIFTLFIFGHYHTKEV